MFLLLLILCFLSVPAQRTAPGTTLSLSTKTQEPRFVPAAPTRPTAWGSSLFITPTRGSLLFITTSGRRNSSQNPRLLLSWRPSPSTKLVTPQGTLVMSWTGTREITCTGGSGLCCCLHANNVSPSSDTSDREWQKHPSFKNIAIQIVMSIIFMSR